MCAYMRALCPPSLMLSLQPLPCPIYLPSLTGAPPSIPVCGSWVTSHRMVTFHRMCHIPPHGSHSITQHDRIMARRRWSTRCGRAPAASPCTSPSWQTRYDAQPPNHLSRPRCRFLQIPLMPQATQPAPREWPLPLSMAMWTRRRVLLLQPLRIPRRVPHACTALPRSVVVLLVQVLSEDRSQRRRGRPAEMARCLLAAGRRISRPLNGREMLKSTRWGKVGQRGLLQRSSRTVGRTRNVVVTATRTVLLSRGQMR